MPACGPKESRRSAEARGARDVKRRHSCWAGKNTAVVEPRSGILARNLRGGRKEKGETMPQTVHSRRVMGDARMMPGHVGARMYGARARHVRKP